MKAFRNLLSQASNFSRSLSFRFVAPLDRLAMLDERQANVVELRYFGGLSVKETAEVLGVAERTVKLDWAMAKGWMQSHFSERGQH